MSRVALYVDGFNLYHAIDGLDRADLKWLNLMALAKSYLQKQDTLVSVTCFTAVMKWDREKAQRHRAYIAALKAAGVEVVESKFQQNTKFCKANNRYCEFREEKQTDVALAVRVMTDLHLGIVDRVLLVTADSDHLPLVQGIREQWPLVAVEVLAPPERMQHARELCAAASRFSEVSAGRLGTCRFPRDVADGTGKVVARRPAPYNPD